MRPSLLLLLASTAAAFEPVGRVVRLSLRRAMPPGGPPPGMPPPPGEIPPHEPFPNGDPISHGPNPDDMYIPRPSSFYGPAQDGGDGGFFRRQARPNPQEPPMRPRPVEYFPPPEPPRQALEIYPPLKITGGKYVKGEPQAGYFPAVDDIMPDPIPAVQHTEDPSRPKKPALEVYPPPSITGGKYRQNARENELATSARVSVNPQQPPLSVFPPQQTRERKMLPLDPMDPQPPKRKPQKEWKHGPRPLQVYPPPERKEPSVNWKQMAH